jgi:secreted trypsin-like serine protease
MHKRRRITALATAIGATLAVAAPAGAIVNGTPDVNGTYASVGMVRFDQGGSSFRCSGTLIAPKVVLTAAHCTEGSTNVRVTFALNAATSAGPTFYTAAPGGVHTHPGWTGSLGTKLLKDTGIIVLQNAPPVPIAPLAPVGYLDSINAKRATYTMVGYGVEYRKPADGAQKKTAFSDFIRKFATATLQTLTVDVIKLQVNPNDARDDGGSCGGDSGGSVWVNGLVVGDDSWGTSQFCSGGAGGYQRVDTPAVRNWINEVTGLTL